MASLPSASGTASTWHFWMALACAYWAWLSQTIALRASNDLFSYSPTSLIESDSACYCVRALNAGFFLHRGFTHTDLWQPFNIWLINLNLVRSRDSCYLQLYDLLEFLLPLRGGCQVSRSFLRPLCLGWGLYTHITGHYGFLLYLLLLSLWFLSVITVAHSLK